MGKGYYPPPGRSRQTLAMSKLPEFTAHCVSKGWMVVPNKGDYEVLRMTKKGSEPLIVHGRLEQVFGHGQGHATTWGISARLLQSWLATRRNQQNAGATP